MTDDQKPMSAEDKAKEIMGPVIDWATSRPIQSFSDTAGAQVIDVLTEATEAIATALRDHAAEAVAAERERLMRGDKVKIEVVQGVEGPALYMNDTRVAGFKPWGGGQTVHGFKVKRDQLFAAIRARTEGGEGDA